MSSLNVLEVILEVASSLPTIYLFQNLVFMIIFNFIFTIRACLLTLQCRRLKFFLILVSQFFCANIIISFVGSVLFVIILIFNPLICFLIFLTLIWLNLQKIINNIYFSFRFMNFVLQN